MPPEEHRTQISNMIEVPAPTPWPFVTTFGLALLLAGLVTSLALSVVGFVVILFGAVGWFRDVLPMSKELSVAVVETPAPIFARSIRRVESISPVGIHRRALESRRHLLTCRFTLRGDPADDAVALHGLLGKFPRA